MMLHWNMIEADFQREYQIDLVTSDMSWRKFLSLLGGLSGESAFFRVMKDKPEIIEDSTDVIADMQRLIATKKK